MHPLHAQHGERHQPPQQSWSGRTSPHLPQQTDRNVTPKIRHRETRPQSLGDGFLFCAEIQRKRVNAVSLPCRRWTVVEHVTQMRAAICTLYFSASHAEDRGNSASLFQSRILFPRKKVACRSSRTRTFHPYGNRSTSQKTTAPSLLENRYCAARV